MSLAAADHLSFLHLTIQDRAGYLHEPITSSGLFIENCDFATSPFSAEAIGSIRASGGLSDRCSAFGSGLFIGTSERSRSISSLLNYIHYHQM